MTSHRFGTSGNEGLEAVGVELPVVFAGGT